MSQKKFAKHGKGRNAVRIPIFKKSEAYPYYRIAYYESGKRVVRSFRTYSEALAAAEDKAEALATKGKAPELRDDQVSDAKSAYEVLDHHFKATGKRVSLTVLANEYTNAMRKLGDKPLSEAIDGFLTTVATIQRKPLSEAVEEFIAGRQSKTVAPDGKRPQLSAGYHYNVSMWLREFAKTFPGHAVCDLTKELLNLYMGQHSAVSPKTRNERRNVVRMLLKWCVRQDYLVATNRLLEADSMTREIAEPEEIEFYTAEDLAAMLQTASEQDDYRPLLPIIALQGLGGVRLQEAVRLTWKDVFHVAGHVEISSAKSKTRARRLVTICASLGQWLAPYRQSSGLIWTQCLDKFHSDFGALLGLLKIPARRNGLRHGFCTYHFALNANENLTAAEAGNSPGMIHSRYKGLVKKPEAEKWFTVAPAKAGNVIPMAIGAKA